MSDWGKMLMCDCYVFSSGRKTQIYMESGGRAGPRKSRRDTLLGYGNAVSTKGNVHDAFFSNVIKHNLFKLYVAFVNLCK